MKSEKNQMKTTVTGVLVLLSIFCAARAPSASAGTLISTAPETQHFIHSRKLEGNRIAFELCGLAGSKQCEPIGEKGGYSPSQLSGKAIFSTAKAIAKGALDVTLGAGAAFAVVLATGAIAIEMGVAASEISGSILVGEATAAVGGTAYTSSRFDFLNPAVSWRTVKALRSGLNDSTETISGSILKTADYLEKALGQATRAN